MTTGILRKGGSSKYNNNTRSKYVGRCSNNYRSDQYFSGFWTLSDTVSSSSFRVPESHLFQKFSRLIRNYIVSRIRIWNRLFKFIFCLGNLWWICSLFNTFIKDFKVCCEKEEDPDLDRDRDRDPDPDTDLVLDQKLIISDPDPWVQIITDPDPEHSVLDSSPVRDCRVNWINFPTCQHCSGSKLITYISRSLNL